MRGGAVRDGAVRGEAVRCGAVRDEAGRGGAVKGAAVRGASARGASARGEVVMGEVERDVAEKRAFVRSEVVAAFVGSELVRGVAVKGGSERGVVVRDEGVCVPQTWLAVVAKRSKPPPETLAVWVCGGVRDEGGRTGGAPYGGVDTGHTGPEGTAGAWPSSGGTWGGWRQETVGNW